MYKGMQMDVSLDVTPKDDYRFALNTVVESRYGEIDGLVNENSNQVCLDGIGQVLGAIHINNKIVLFYIDPFGISSISMFDPETCTKQLLLSNQVGDLTFNINYPISGTHKVLDYCDETIIYWVDGINPVRYLNLSKIDELVDTQSLNVFTCSKGLNLVVEGVLDNGGNLESGVYQFAISYINGNYSYITNPISVYKDNLSNDFKNIDGDPAGTHTTKSIQLTINNIDFTHNEEFKIVVIKTVNNIVTVYELPSQQTPGISSTYTYTGFEETTAVALNAVTVPTATFLTAWLIAQHQDRLMLGNLKQTRNIDYQLLANQIETTWFTNKIKIDKGYKNPTIAMNNKSFMADEVYSIGIVWEFCDGSYSPAFHIPGPTKESVADCVELPILSEFVNPGVEGALPPTQYTSIDDIVPENDANNFLGCPAPVWKIFITACIIEEPEVETIIEGGECGEPLILGSGVWHKGRLAYWEDCEVYPEVERCDGSLMFGDLTGTPVRYHRMPSRRLEPHFSSNELSHVEDPENLGTDYKPYDDLYVYPIGLEFSNVIPPPDAEVQVKRYHIVYVKRTESNKSVVAKGLTHKCYTSTDAAGGGAVQDYPKKGVNSYLTFPFTGGASFNNEYEKSSNYTFHSPNTSISNYYSSKFNNPSLNVTYAASDYQHKGKGKVYGEVEAAQYALRENINLDTKVMVPRLVNRKVDFSTYLNANSIVATNTVPINNMLGESAVLFHIPKTDDLLYPTDYFYFNIACGNFTLVPGMNDNSRVDYQTGNNPNDVLCAYSHYVALKNYRCSQYGNLLGQQYISTGYYNNLILNISTDEYEPTYANFKVYGDSFINYWAYRRTNGTFDINIDSTLFNLYENIQPENYLIHSVFESDINVDLRHEGNLGSGEIYYPSLGRGVWVLDSSIPNGGEPQASYLQQFRYDDDADEYVGLGIDNYYNYNIDYSKVNDTRLFLGMGLNYKTCACNNQLKNTIAVSEEDNLETKEDGWLVFRYNNYLNIPRFTGQLNNIFTIANNFFAHTENNLWRVYTTEDQLLTNTQNLYIGSGSIFGQTPKYIYAADEGASGLQQNRGTLLNQYGYFFIDNKAGILYNFDGEKVKPLNVGMLNWQKEMLPYEIQAANNYTNPEGIGWHMGFDHRHSRLLVTFKDYKPVAPVYIQNFKYYLTGAGTEVSALDTDWFCNTSFTLSYSYLTERFVSFHSYIPEMYIQTRKDLFSAKSNIDPLESTLWKHNKPNEYQMFYNEYFPHKLEIVDTWDTIKTWANILYQQYAYEYNALYGSEVLVLNTFDSAVIWNTRQNSGTLALVAKTEEQDDYMENAINDNVTYVNNKEGLWFFNQFTDAVVDYTRPHNTQDCLAVVNQAPNPIVLGTKEYYNISDFRDNFIVYRLVKNNVADRFKRYVTKQLASNATKSNR